MPGIATSRIFTAWQTLYERLRDATWTGGDPVVALAYPVGNIPRELVVVSGVPASDAQIEAVTLGKPGRNEVFILRVGILVEVPGLDAAGVLARLEELADVVQNELRDDQTGQPLPLDDNDTSGAIVRMGGVTRIAPRVDAGAEGFVGTCDIDITVTARL